MGVTTENTLNWGGTEKRGGEQGVGVLKRGWGGSPLQTMAWISSAIVETSM